MTVSSAKLVGELQHYFNSFIIKSSLNKDKLPIPVDIPEVYFFYKNSFIRLLFDDNFKDSLYDYYNILWTENPSRLSWPSLIRTRMSIYTYSSKYLELTEDSSATNIFSLQDNDILLLDSLLSYRLGFSLTINESVSSLDFNGQRLSANINLLSSRLSKLIFIYLKLKIYGNYSDYDNGNIISNSILETMYECYVNNEIFKYVSSKEGLSS